MLFVLVLMWILKLFNIIVWDDRGVINLIKDMKLFGNME